MKFSTVIILTAMTLAVAACSDFQTTATKITGWFQSESTSPVVKAIGTETASLLKTFVFTAGSQKLAGADWADSAAAGIYAAQEQLANDPTALNAFLGGYLPANSAWTAVIDGLVSKLIRGELNTKSERIAALNAIAETLNAQAAAQRAAQ